MRELTFEEMDQVAGGIAPILVAMAVAGTAAAVGAATTWALNYFFGDNNTTVNCNCQCS